jgi:CO/xanthine dehydrogenase FAD-binding subunit/aerobic-type carbon monoxide dehydrogenase small subunit (CoxS/CutS family)
MKPSAFRYEAPGTLTEALDVLAEHGDDARPLAGGQSLVPMLNLRLATPEVVVDLNRVDELASSSITDGRLVVGALTRQRALERCAAAGAVGALADGLPLIGHVATRNRGTVGGSVAHADPAAELPLALLALGGAVVAAGPAGRREIPAEQLFAGFLTTTLEPGELVVAVHFPLPGEREGSALVELAQRHGDFALAAAAVSVRLDGDGQVVAARVAVGAVADRPLLLPEPAAALVAGASAAQAGQLATAAVHPSGTLHAPPDYQRHLAGVLVTRAIDRAAQRARSGTDARLPAPCAPQGAGRRRAEQVTVNGRVASLEGVPGRRLLSDFLRHDLGLRGTHVGCEHGVCGACTVRLDGAAVRSCLLLARQAAGTEIRTVEALAPAGADRRLHPLQEAFRRRFALQCGFCTPGILMTAAERLEDAGAPPDEDEIRRLLSGHMCRCTGYEPVVAAVAEAAGRLRENAAP